jgi:hypothetical protein
MRIVWSAMCFGRVIFSQHSVDAAPGDASCWATCASFVLPACSSEVRRHAVFASASLDAQRSPDVQGRDLLVREERTRSS